MARYTGPKHKLARREGINIIEKNSKSLERRLNTLPGIHGRKGRRKKSEYGIQLREKQKLKGIYGLLEKQFSRYIKEAEKTKGNTEEALLQLLEGRLDNIVYRLGFAKSRNQARQIVTHRHVFVNREKVNIPSYHVKAGDEITLSAKISNNPDIKGLMEIKPNLPAYLNKEGATGKVIRHPKSDDVTNPVDYQLVIEYYSR